MSQEHADEPPFLSVPVPNPSVVQQKLVVLQLSLDQKRPDNREHNRPLISPV